MTATRDEYVYTSRLLSEIKDHIAQNVIPLHGRSFYVFDQDDLEAHLSTVQLPLVGVMYLSMMPYDGQSGANPPKDYSMSSAVTQELMISVVVVDEYAGAGLDNDNNDFTKHSITDLLDDTRFAMLGYRGANLRPWQWVGESPLETSLQNAVMYAQTWRTLVPLTKHSST